MAKVFLLMSVIAIIPFSYFAAVGNWASAALWFLLGMVWFVVSAVWKPKDLTMPSDLEVVSNAYVYDRISLLELEQFIVHVLKGGRVDNSGRPKVEQSVGPYQITNIQDPSRIKSTLTNNYSDAMIHTRRGFWAGESHNDGK